MNQIPAKVVNVFRLEDEYLLTVWVGSEEYLGTFDGLSFGENKPHVGWYHYGWLELAYRENPGLRAGQTFPLWSVQ